MKKNCSTKPIPKEKWRRNALPGHLGRDSVKRGPVFFAFFASPKQIVCVCTVTNTSVFSFFLALWEGRVWSMGPLSLPSQRARKNPKKLYVFIMKNAKHWFGACEKYEKRKTNCSTKPSLNQNRRRIDLQARPLVVQSRKNEATHDNRSLSETFFRLEFQQKL